jgi:DNA replication protein DnaC
MKKQIFDNFEWARVEMMDQNKKPIPKGKGFYPFCYPYQKIIFFGKQGVGKTHLAHAFIDEYRMNREDDFDHLYSGSKRDKMNSITDFIDAQELYSVFFGIQPHLLWEQQQDAIYDYRQILKSELLVIDDLGSEKITESELFEQGLKKLIDSYTGKLIITTNLKIENLKKRYGIKNYSRMVEGALLIFIKGADYRQKDL